MKKVKQKMITVNILQDNDTILPDDWCRPLLLNTEMGGMSDFMSHVSMYSGSPKNNVKWVKVKCIYGPCWLGRAYGELNDTNVPMEFVRGDIPDSHKLNMSYYSSCADFCIPAACT